MKIIEIHVHGRYEIEIDDNEDTTDAVEQSFINFLDYDPDLEIERFEVFEDGIQDVVPYLNLEEIKRY